MCPEASTCLLKADVISMEMLSFETREILCSRVLRVKKDL